MVVTTIAMKCYAQEVTMELLEPVGNVDGYSYWMHAQADSGLLVGIDRNGKMHPTAPFKLPNPNETLDRIFTFPGKIVALTSQPQGSDRLTYYAQPLAPEGNPKGERTAIFSVTGNPVGVVDVVRSPDSTKVCVFAGLVTHKKSAAVLKLTTLDQKLKVTDSVTYNVSEKELEDIRYHCFDAAITNEGLTYLSMYKSIGDSRERAYFIMIYDPAKKSFDEVNLGRTDLQGVTSFVDDSGDLIITGFYGNSHRGERLKTSKDLDYKGVYLIKVNGTQKSITYQKFTALPENVEDLRTFSNQSTSEKETFVLRHNGGYTLVSRAISEIGYLTFLNHPFVVSITDLGELKFAISAGIYDNVKNHVVSVDERLMFAWNDPDKAETYLLLRYSVKGISREKNVVALQSVVPANEDESKAVSIVATIDSTGNTKYRLLETTDDNAGWIPPYSIVDRGTIMLLGRKNRKYVYGRGK